MTYPNRSPHGLPEEPPSGQTSSYGHSPMSSHVRGHRNSNQPSNTPVRSHTLSSGAYPDEMISQAEEQQSIYRDHSTSGVDYEVEDYHNPNPRKRINPEPLDNPKKRASVAVSILSAQGSSSTQNTRRLTSASAMSAVGASRNATAQSQDAGYVLSSMLSASIKSQESS